MPQYIITPWKYPSELLQVRREIYQLGESAPPKDDRRHAVDWVAAWKLRGNLPHAVESTAHLVDAILHHDLGRNSSFSIRATYSAAFCRFVTGFCDLGQNAMGRITMVDVAKELDMPASFVELRHEATHGELPSLQRLSRSTKQALDWLWHYYWAKLDDEKETAATRKRKRGMTAVEPVDSKVLKDALTAFLTKRREEIKSKVNGTAVESASGTTCVQLVQCCLNQTQNMAVLADILVKERMLIPANRALGSSMDGAFKIWGNLLRRLTLHQKNFIEVLLRHMVYVMSQPSQLALQLDHVRQAVQLWIEHIFSSLEWADLQIKSQVEAQRGTVVNECIMSPNSFTSSVATKLVAGGTVQFKETWRPLLDLLS